MLRRPPVNATATAAMWAAAPDAETLNVDHFFAALVAGADVNARDAGGRTILHHLSLMEPRLGRFARDTPAAAVRRVLQWKGVDLNARTMRDVGETPLHLAAQLGDPRETMTALLEHVRTSMLSPSMALRRCTALARQAPWRCSWLTVPTRSLEMWTGARRCMTWQATSTPDRWRHCCRIRARLLQ